LGQRERNRKGGGRPQGRSASQEQRRKVSRESTCKRGPVGAALSGVGRIHAGTKEPPSARVTGGGSLKGGGPHPGGGEGCLKMGVNLTMQGPGALALGLFWLNPEQIRYFKLGTRGIYIFKNDVSTGSGTPAFLGPKLPRQGTGETTRTLFGTIRSRWG